MENQDPVEHPIHDVEDQPNEPKFVVGKDGLPVALPDEGHAGKEEHPEKIEGMRTESSGSDNEDEAEPSELDEKKQVGFMGTVMNLLNSLLGAGILSVPNCFCDTGTGASTIIIVIIAFLSYLATYMVVKVQKDTGGAGFGDLAFRTLGKAGLVTLDILTLLFLISAQLAYIIIGGDMILSWFDLGGIDLSGFLPRALVILVYSVCIPMALTIPRNISFLRYFSTATVVFILFYVVVLVIKGAKYISENGGINKTCITWGFGMEALNTISIASLTFALPCVCLPSLKLYQKDAHKRYVVSATTVVVCTLIVMIPSYFGYFIFGKDTEANVLNSFPNDDILMVVTRGVFFFVVSFAFPMVGQSTLSSWSSMIYKVDAANSLSTGKRAVVLVLTDGIPLIIGMLLKSAKPVLGIGGAIGGCIANFTFPAIMFFKVSKKKWTSVKNLATLLFAVFGLVAGILSTYQAVINAIDSFS